MLHKPKLKPYYLSVLYTVCLFLHCFPDFTLARCRNRGAFMERSAMHARAQHRCASAAFRFEQSCFSTLSPYTAVSSPHMQLQLALRPSSTLFEHSCVQSRGRRRLSCTAQHPKSTGPAANPAEEQPSDAVSSASDAKQSWSTSPAVGVSCWQHHGTKDGLGPGQATGSHMYANIQCCILWHGKRGTTELTSAANGTLGCNSSLSKSPFSL